jgi:hypothetical protein
VRVTAGKRVIITTRSAVGPPKLQAMAANINPNMITGQGWNFFI